LKTLEEPPSYVIFILATTEKHKVIPTILSRCQIFDFQRIQPQAIVHQLKTIAAQENIPYEEEGLHLISQKADGALRDALAMFDLIVTFGSGKLTYQAALENLHVLDYTYYFKLIDALLQGKVADALLLYDEILRTGFDNLYFISGLSEHLRNLLVCQDRATLPLLEIPQSIQLQYHDQAKKATPTFLLKALQIVNQYDIHYKSSHNKRLHLELCLIELAQISGPMLTNRDLDPTPTTPLPISPTPEQPTPSTIQPLATPQPVKTPKEPITKKEVKSNSSTKHSHPGNLQTTIKLPQLEQLKAHITQSNQDNKQLIATVAEEQEFNKERLLSAWKNYAEKLKEDGKLPAYRLLDQDIELDGTTILLQFTNAVQEDILINIKENLLTYLRTELQYANLDVKGTLIQETKTKKPYTAQEKFNYLAQKNPHLQLFQQKLQLLIVD
jgi:DNA polymerase-3 subunit gamma/tau